MTNTQTTADTATFEVGTTYTTGSGDYVWTYTVASRTAKFMTITDQHGETSRVGIKVSDFNGSHEWALPMGTFSQAPVISADRPVAA